MTTHFFNSGSFLQEYYIKFKVDEANTIHDKEFFSVDHWMIFIKDNFYNNGNNSIEILMLDDPKALDYYDACIEVDNKDWEKIEKQISLYGNFFKFFQNPLLAVELLKTGDDKDKIAFCCNDKKWGIGMNIYDPACSYPDLWDGENWLGDNLVEVRDLLQKFAQYMSPYMDCEDYWMDHTCNHKMVGGKIADKFLDKMGKAFKGRPRVEINLSDIAPNNQSR